MSDNPQGKKYPFDWTDEEIIEQLAKYATEPYNNNRSMFGVKAVWESTRTIIGVNELQRRYTVRESEVNRQDVKRAHRTTIIFAISSIAISLYAIFSTNHQYTQWQDDQIELLQQIASSTQKLHGSNQNVAK